MTTDPKALIAEARKAADSWSAADRPDLLRRLAAALEEATVPEGWRVTEYQREDGARVWLDDEEEKPDWGFIKAKRSALSTTWGYPTAREAMAALDGEEVTAAAWKKADEATAGRKPKFGFRPDRQGCAPRKNDDGATQNIAKK